MNETAKEEKRSMWIREERDNQNLMMEQIFQNLLGNAAK
ncbi:MAG: hypothetical protein C5S48_04705 [Candidatus Methanogaster sp.]|nr:MAG: hypothetical protein C5S48_04705 [ANME-2 cluster archaeon]